MSDESRSRWATSAAGWAEQADRMAQATMPVSTWLIDAVGPQPGQTLLELAAGPGDVGLLAAELVEPGGTVICSDFSPEMLTVAQSRARARGLTNVRFRQIDLRVPIDQPAASVDGVLCRWGYMLLDDPQAALRETRRVLKTGARLALAAWTGPQENRWSSAPHDALVALDRLPAPDRNAPGQFTWGAEGLIAEHLEAAGFTEHVVDTVSFSMRFESERAWWRSVRTMSAAVREVAESMPEEEVMPALEDAAAPFRADDGSLEFPARTWVAAAAA